MIKYFQTMLLMALSFNMLLAISPKQIIKNGTRLVYDANYHGSTYEYIITVKNNTKFEWRMIGPTKTAGSVNLSLEAIENATGIFNYFSADTVKQTDQCFVILSKKMFNTFKDNGYMEVYTDQKNEVKTLFSNPIDHTQSFGYNNNFSNEFNCQTVTNGNDYQITYVNDPEFPLIIELKLEWSIKLKTIYNN